MRITTTEHIILSEALKGGKEKRIQIQISNLYKYRSILIWAVPSAEITSLLFTPVSRADKISDEILLSSYRSFLIAQLLYLTHCSYSGTTANYTIISF